MIESVIVNRRIESFEIHEHGYCSISIDNGYVLQCSSLLRCISDDGALVTNQDHGHSFGLAQPFDAETEIAARVRDKTIISVERISDTNDLILRFDNTRIEILCSSCGYENWQLNGPNGFSVVGHGGLKRDH